MSTPSVYRSFCLITLVSRLFGVMPLRMVPGDRTAGGGPICMMSMVDYVYSFTLLVVSIVHGVLAPFYVLHTNMPHDYKNSIFTTVTAEDVPPTNIGVGGNDDNDDYDASDMATAMKILNPLMTILACVCSRLVALTFLHRRFGVFIAVLHNTDRLMEATVRSHVSSSDPRRSLLEMLDENLLRYFVVIGLPVNIHYLYTVSAFNSVAGIVWCVVLALSNLTCISTDVQFIRCASMLQYRFRAINNELQSIESVWNFKRRSVLLTSMHWCY